MNIFLNALIGTLIDLFLAGFRLFILVMFLRIWSIIGRFCEPARMVLEFFIEGIEDFLKSLR